MYIDDINVTYRLNQIYFQQPPSPPPSYYTQQILYSGFSPGYPAPGNAESARFSLPSAQLYLPELS